LTLRSDVVPAVLPALLLALSACSSAPTDSAKDTAADTSGDSGLTGDSASICGDTAVYDTYSEGMSRLGDAGVLQFAIAAASPAPPDKGDNVWTIALTNPAGESLVSDETVILTPFMPEHGHGTNPATVTTTNNGDGTYTTSAFDLFMGGWWQLTVSASGGGVGADQALFAFCIEG